MIIFAAVSSPSQRKDGLASGKLLKNTKNWMFYHVLPIKNGDFLLLTLVYQICSCMSQVLRQWAHL